MSLTIIYTIGLIAFVAFGWHVARKRYKATPKAVARSMLKYMAAGLIWPAVVPVAILVFFMICLILVIVEIFEFIAEKTEPSQ